LIYTRFFNIFQLFLHTLNGIFMFFIQSRYSGLFEQSIFLRDLKRFEKNFPFSFISFFSTQQFSFSSLSEVFHFLSTLRFPFSSLLLYFPLISTNLLFLPPSYLIPHLPFLLFREGLNPQQFKFSTKNWEKKILKIKYLQNCFVLRLKSRNPDETTINWNQFLLICFKLS